MIPGLGGWSTQGAPLALKTEAVRVETLKEQSLITKSVFEPRRIRVAASFQETPRIDASR